MKNDIEPWYAAKTVYYYLNEDVYEERIVLHRASGFEEAWDKNEKEVSLYTKGLQDIDVSVERIKTVEIYHMFDVRLKSGMEVFSSMRRVHKKHDEYIRQAYEEGMDYKDKL